MPAASYRARVRKDGSLTFPSEVRRQLSLSEGDEVLVRVESATDAPEERKPNPLYGIIGIGKKGPSDGAENHDLYLYGKESA